MFKVERLLSIIAAKRIIIHEHNNNKLGQLSQKQIFLVADTAACLLCWMLSWPPGQPGIKHWSMYKGSACPKSTVCHPHTPHKQQDMGNKWPAGPCYQGAHQTNAVFAVHQLNFYICTVQQNCVLKEQVAVEQSQAFGPPALGQQSCLSCFLLSAPCCLAGTFQSSPMEKCVGSVTAVSVQRHK